MTWAVCCFELSSSFRRVSTYVYFVTFFAISFVWFVSAAGGFESVSSTVEGCAANSPFVLHYGMAGMSMLGIGIIAAVAGQSIHQDFLHKTYPLVFTSPISKLQLLAGRFIAANIVLLFVFLSIGLGYFAGSLMPTLDPDLVVRNRLMAYLRPYLIIVIPNTLFAAAIFFAMAALRRNMMLVYAAAVLIFAAYMSAGALMRDLESHVIAGLLEPFGSYAFVELTRYTTIAEKNSQLVPLTGLLLLNRLLWLGVGAAILGFTFYRFRFAEGSEDTRHEHDRNESSLTLRVEQNSLDLESQATFSNPIRLLPGLTWREFRDTVKSLSFFVIVLAMIWVICNASRHLGSFYGTSLYPVTSNVLRLGQGNDLFIFITITIYSGQMVWREREANIAQLYDVLPIPNWIPFASKLFALMLIQALLYAIVILCGVAIQASQGYYNFELGVYFKALLGIEWIHACLVCALAIVVQVIVNHKYLGHFVIALYYIAMSYMPQFGFDHHLLRYASHPGYTYSDINGFGNFITPIVHFNLYWAALAVLLATIANPLWVRGTESNFVSRLRRARSQFTFRSRAVAIASMSAVVCLGGFIFYNTNVLNEHRTQTRGERRRVDYEKKHKPFEHSPQPRIRSVNVHVDIYPDSLALCLRGGYQLVNKSDKPISTIMVGLSPLAGLGRLSVGSLQQASEVDELSGVHLFRLPQPMKPGETLPLEFDVEYTPRGFTNYRSELPVSGNGTFFNLSHFPQIGYSPKFELLNNKTRRKHGLAPKRRVARIDDPRARENNHIGRGADWIDFEATVSTSADQIAIAPGSLQREWSKGGRRFFHYKADAPMLNFFSFVSARYEVRRDRWNDMEIEIYYHKGHEYNLDAMAKAVRMSLEYYSTNFGPYHNKQFRIVEVPRSSLGSAQAFSGTIPYSEAAGFITKVDPKKAKDLHYPFYITAHEVAHQWWAHQVVGGNVEGAFMLTESLAQYSALMIMKHEFGPAKMKRVMRYELDEYLKGRAKSRKEMPLAYDDIRNYVHYNKGSLAMYALQDYIGEDAVNRALADFVQATAFQEPPYTTSMELVERFRQVTPEHLKYIIEDLFETITLYDLRAKSATYRIRDDGKYEVRLSVAARKLRADTAMAEKQIAIDDLIDIGVMDSRGQLQYLKKHGVDANTQDIAIIVPRLPTKAGIDPRNILIDRNPNDNVIQVEHD